MFTNPNVPLDSLPAFAGAEYHPMDARYPRLVLGVASVLGLFVLAALVVVLLVKDAPVALRWIVPGGVLLLFTWISGISYTYARRLRFAVREHDVILRSGVFFRKEVVQPLSRVQHVERVQGPLDKRFGLAKLKLYSAGTGGLSFAIPGLTEEMALRLQGFILERKRELRDTAGLDGIADREASPG